MSNRNFYRVVLSNDFLGFVNIYKPVSEFVPKNKIIIDFGCYIAAQSYLFKEHKAYIGVDTTELLRFTPKNAQHFVGTIQDFINNKAKELLLKFSNLDFFAICSYVPDFEATEMVRKTFQNVLCYYPKS